MNMNRRPIPVSGGEAPPQRAANRLKSGALAREKTINAGPAAKYAADGVYSRHRDMGFFIVRKGEKLFAISSYCTHRKCKLAAESDRSFYCPCHGSTFDPDGHVDQRTGAN